MLEDPNNEEIINQNIKYKNTILSQKLAAKYLTQVGFQKNLDVVFRELTAPEGHEFNCLEVGHHIQREQLRDKLSLKALLLANHMVYVGTVDADKNVHFDNERVTDAAQIVVLSQGKA